MKKEKKREAFTSEEMETARKMWKDRNTYTQIGAKLGRSNNSISGMMSRNRDKFPERYGDLMKKNKSAKSLPNYQAVKADKIARLTTNSLRRMFHEALNPPANHPKPKETHEAYDKSRLPYAVTMAKLENNCCRWSVTEHPRGTENLFCNEVRAGKNYCDTHQQRAWRMA